MVTSTPSNPKRNRKKVPPRLIDNSLGYDFAVLGLKAHESRVSVIRKAAAETANRVNHELVGETEHDALLSQIAASTYRLLDPRRRSKPAERVQLCIHSEEDLDRQKLARTNFYGQPARLVPATKVS